jgi:hypothetical protein
MANSRLGLRTRKKLISDDISSKSYKRFLDKYPIARFAFSLRKLKNDYNGNCIRVRRTSDSVEQDIGFFDGALDTASLLSFIGASSGAVAIWYDQSGNQNNAVQTTAARQPLIVSSGVLYTENNLPIIRNPNAGTIRAFQLTVNYIINLPIHTIAVGKIYGLPTNGFNSLFWIVTGNQGGNLGRYTINGNASNFQVFRRLTSGSNNLLLAAYSTDPFVIQGMFRTSGIDGRQNGTDYGTTAYSGTPYIADNTYNFSSLQPDQNANYGFYEIIHYEIDRYNERIDMEADIDGYYDIY